MPGILFVNSSPSTTSSPSKASDTSGLFDQSALSALAQRLVEAARRAGADEKKIEDFKVLAVKAAY